mmetsp:Transcript_27090/g.68485  ORF Transcript_27090/g.68485 Transcript_27090/m.68485 type:complete len:308 (+) Transcript_27090:131-1054(+)
MCRNGTCIPETAYSRFRRITWPTSESVAGSSVRLGRPRAAPPRTAAPSRAAAPPPRTPFSPSPPPPSFAPRAGLGCGRRLKLSSWRASLASALSCCRATRSRLAEESSLTPSLPPSMPPPPSPSLPPPSSPSLAPPPSPSLPPPPSLSLPPPPLSSLSPSLPPSLPPPLLPPSTSSSALSDHTLLSSFVRGSCAGVAAISTAAWPCCSVAFINAETAVAFSKRHAFSLASRAASAASAASRAMPLSQLSPSSSLSSVTFEPLPLSSMTSEPLPLPSVTSKSLKAEPSGSSSSPPPARRPRVAAPLCS